MRSLLTIAFLTLYLIVVSFGTTQAIDANLISYQGKLDSAGTPINGNRDITFRLFPTPTEGSILWSEQALDVPVSSGLFTHLLGSVNSIPDSAFDSNELWLEVEVEGQTIGTRSRLTASAVSKRVASVDGSSGGTITSKISIGPGHTNTGDNAFVAGINNVVSGYRANIGGGEGNNASTQFATVGGGYLDTASGNFAVVSGGNNNTASGNVATVSGGTLNIAGGFWSTVSGGRDNTTIGGGATIGGGKNNTATGSNSTVSGGDSNSASSNSAAVSGGVNNTASGGASTVAGGVSGTASGLISTVGGGEKNTASGDYATVPGGYGNQATGSYAFAAGFNAKALHNGTFVWSNGFGDSNFNSTGDNQFLISAPGGVGIGTNSPTASLDVVGDLRVSGNLIGSTPWTPFPFAAGYDNYEDAHPEHPETVQTVQYRKIGDMVYMRGLVHKSDHSVIPQGATIGSLPVGFRPPAMIAFSTVPGSYIEIWTTGEVFSFFSPNEHQHFDGVIFSTSP